MVGSSLATKSPILAPFCGMDHQKSNFSLISDTFLSDAVEANWCYFFEKWLMKLKCPNLLKPLGTLIQENYWSFYPSDPSRIPRFNMRHPVEEVLVYPPIIRVSSKASKRSRGCIKATDCSLLMQYLLKPQFFQKEKTKARWRKVDCTKGFFKQTKVEEW